MSPSQPNIYTLAADNSPSLLPLLRSNPALASSQDDSGYSLLHAAASYGHVDLLRALVQELQVNVNLVDEDGETCLFVTESVDVARCLIEELGVDRDHKNHLGLKAEESIASDGEFPYLIEYLQGSQAGDYPRQLLQSSISIPPNVTVNVGNMPDPAADGDGGPDPEFKRRIEELAARENFHTEEGQRELRQLVTDALKDVNADTQERGVRRRTD
ncbi:ankyrin repeat protein [Histoplasma capsulatum var. duboisii H88]|uniref:Ankyrin repeat protein n=2 Tax=Ajellomyces capsulatus TaxID=5037 RepID=F0UBL8_AJEC8|nr:ankyrin repeat protein [Histoplasma capsulatum H143]EGC43074.1 ankyrin repeat protein [Histoplasma capsulatum var. duboisii H88]QSS49259.1 ankyrin repeat protein [Histoplasma capsulatum var. duboisii H88]